MAQVLIHHARFIGEQPLLADRCPNCDADFSQAGSLRRWAYVHRADRGHLHSGLPPEYTFAVDDGPLEGTDYLYAFAYHCEGCGYELLDTAVEP